MDRESAYEELLARLEDKNRIRHSLAVEAIMRKLAAYLQEDVALWGLSGLLHDIDLEKVNGNLEKHGLVGAEILEGLNVNPTVIYAIKSHNPALGIERRRKIDKALFCVDPLSRLIMSCALILPDKKLEPLDVPFVMEKLHEKGFFNEDNHKQIITCDEIGLSLEVLIDLGLSAMKEIHDQLAM